MNKFLAGSRLVLVVALALPVWLPASGQSISDAAMAQIREILEEKQRFTPAQRKMDSDLIFTAKAARGELAGRSFARISPRVQTDAAGSVVVDIKGTVSDVVSEVNAQGGQVLAQYPAYNMVRATIPLQNIEKLAGNPSVASVSKEEVAIHHIGALTSQGYISHSANAVAAMGINGAGVKVGVISDSASAKSVTALIASGDLGANTTVLAGQAGSTSGKDEGTALMEIIQDLAPGVQLYFATDSGGQAAMASNIAALATAGCSIIVDDVAYIAEAAFQDDIVARAVNTFVAGGGLYFSSSGNSGNLTNQTSGVWEGDFADGGPAGAPISTLDANATIHSFGSGQLYNSLTTVAPSTITLKWSDPLGSSSNDYDLFVLDSSGSTVKGYSITAQTGKQDPIETVAPFLGGLFCGLTSSAGYCSAVGDRIVIVRTSGAARALRLDTNGGQLKIGTAGATFGHNGGENTVSVAASHWNSAHTGTKPFTGRANPTEAFSSDGPRKMFYNPDGTPITPGNVLFATNGGKTLQKPDITAADGVGVKTPGFFPFFGTSAASPHAAAIAALVKAAKPSLTAQQIRNILVNTALDNMASGADRDGGYGLVMALQAVSSALSQ